MGKRKYNHEVGNVYLLMDDTYPNDKRYILRLLVQKKIEKGRRVRHTKGDPWLNWKGPGPTPHKVKVSYTFKNDEKYGMFSITIGQGGKFHIGTNWICRATLNGFARDCVVREQFEAEGHRLGFLVITGCTLETMIEKAVKRYQKNMKYRYSVKFDPEEIKSLLKYVEPEPEGDINGNADTCA